MKNLVTQITGESGEEVEVRYETIVDEVFDDNGEVVGETLGIKIIISSTGEEKSIRHITADFRKMDELFDFITKGQVTPCTLSDVIYDLIA